MNYGRSLNKPDYGAALEQLQHLNDGELRELVANDARIEEIVNDLQQMKQLASEKEMILASNKSLAEYNLSQEPVLIERRQTLLNVHNSANQLITEVTEKKSKLDALKRQTSLDTLLAILQTKAAESEEQSESFRKAEITTAKTVRETFVQVIELRNIISDWLILSASWSKDKKRNISQEELAEKFLDGSQDIDSFLEEYLEKRQEAHLHRVKCDKMKELISTQGSGIPMHDPVISRRAPPVPQAAPYPPSWGAPNSYNGPAYSPQSAGVPMPMPMNNYYR